MTDEQILEAMHLHYVDGMRLVDVGERFGKSRSAMAGIMKRIRDDTNVSDPDGILNGTMPERWWAR